MKPSILLVEDDPTDEKLAILAFRRAEFTGDIHVVRDGAAALEWLRNAGTAGGPLRLPSVVLLDLKLPKVDGLEVVRRLRADPRTRLQPVVVLTASREESDVLRSYAEGVNAYVVKPGDFQVLVAAARAIHTFWVGCCEAPPPAREAS